MSNLNEPYAAIDLGSNSFHMVVANYVDGRALIVDRIKEMVRLAGGLDEQNYLTDEASLRAIECLEKFAQRIKSIPSSNVRAVGTNTLRLAKNGLEFLTRANSALGHNIEIISGREEARLIYLGVANTVFNDSEYRLVIDIGGGSTELIIGKGFKANVTESLFMGCVSISKQFFSNGKITAAAIHDARIAALQEVKNIQGYYQAHGWDTVIGASGTIRTIINVVTEQGWSNDYITPDSLQELQNALIDCGHIDKMLFKSLSTNRRPVFVGGVIVLSAVFEALGIDAMQYSDGALREGLLYDQIGRQHDHDVRDKTVARLSKRYSVDLTHADRLEQSVAIIFDSLSNNWQLDEATDLKMLRWSARLHEVGLAIAHNQYHKHGAYLLAHSDMPGFSRQEQRALSFLVRAHRRKFPLDAFDDMMDSDSRNRLTRLTIILRLAVVLIRGRELINKSNIQITAKKKTIVLHFRKDWLVENPLTEADLAIEADYLSATGYQISFGKDYAE